MKKVDVSEDKLFSLDFLPIEPGVVATEEDLFIFDDRVFKTLELNFQAFFETK